MINFYSFVVSLRSLFCGIETSQMDGFAFIFYLGIPLTIALAPMYAFVSAGVVGLYSAVANVLKMSALAKPVSAVVKRIMENVIRFLVWTALKYLSCHPYGPSVFFSGCVKTFTTLTPNSFPVPLIQPVEVGSIHNGNLILRQWNQAVICVKRLGDLVSDNTIFSHRFTSNGPLLPAAILT